MLLFKKRFHAGLVSGDVRITFRRWKKTHVRPGGRYRCHPIGVLVVDSVEVVKARAITAEDARQSGFESRDELIQYLASASDDPFGPASEVFRIGLHHGGDGDRVEIALNAQLTPEEIDAIDERLARLDQNGAWTRKTLRSILKRPRVAASQLAKQLGRETLPFKEDVRKLKKLGLTQSFEVGYEVSPRGIAFLEARPRDRRRKKA